MTARRDSFNEPAHGSVGGKVLLFAAAVLALAATGVLVLSDDLKYLRLGIVAGLWAALTGAFIAARYRRQVAERAEDDAERQERYELELEREIAARREHELQVEAEARRWAEEKANDDLNDLRAELQGLRQTLHSLLGGEFLVERYALRAEASRMRPLPEGNPLPEPKRLLPAQRADNREDKVVPGESEADTDLIDRVRGSSDALPRRADRSPAQAKERLDRFRSVPKPHPTEVSDRWFMPDGLGSEQSGQSGQESDWGPSWESNRGPAPPQPRPYTSSGSGNGRASSNGRASPNGHAAYDQRSTTSQAGGATNYPDTVGQRAAASARRMQPPPPPQAPSRTSQSPSRTSQSPGRTSAQSAGPAQQPSSAASPAAASANGMPQASPAAASASRMPPAAPGRASPTGSGVPPSARVSSAGPASMAPSQQSQMYSSSQAGSSSQAYQSSQAGSSSQAYQSNRAGSSSQAYQSSQAYPAGQAASSQAQSSQRYPASQQASASSARMSPAGSPAWPQQGSGRPNHALASSTQLPPASQSPGAQSYSQLPSVSPVQASATRLPPAGAPAGGQMPPAAPPGRIQPAGYVGDARPPLSPGVPPPMTGGNPAPAEASGYHGYGPGYGDPGASGYHDFGPGHGDASPAASSGYQGFGPGYGEQNPQALSSGYVPPVEFGPGAGGPMDRRSAESGYVAPVARPNRHGAGDPAGGRHSGGHALPEPDMPSGSHATGRSVSELLASNGGTAGPRRRRRRED